MFKIFLLLLMALTSAFGGESRFECPEFDLLYGGPDQGGAVERKSSLLDQFRPTLHQRCTNVAS